MNKEKLLEMGLTEEQANKVLNEIKDIVPYARFKEVNDERNNLKNQILEKEKQLEELAQVKTEKDGLIEKLAQLETRNTNTINEYETKINKVRLDGLIELALTKSGANNNKSVIPLLNIDNIKLENGVLVGLDEQITSLKETDGYLFKGQEVSVPSGIKPTPSNNEPIKKNGIKSYEEILKEL